MVAAELSLVLKNLMEDRGPIGLIREESGNSSFIAHIFHLLMPIGFTDLIVFSVIQNFF